MLFQLKLLRSLLNPKLQKLISVFVVSFLIVGCNSLIPIYQNCNFPEQNLVPGGLINIKKKNAVIKYCIVFCCGCCAGPDIMRC